MNTLATLQSRFQDYLLGIDTRVKDHIVGTGRASAEVRLAIYAEAYRLRLLETLEDNYPVLCAYLGADEFERLGRAYIEAHPSRTRSIRWYGDAMADFLTATAPYTERPVLAETAAFEWALRAAFDAPDTATLTVHDMAALAPEHWPTMHLVLHPSVHRLDLHWNAPAIWKALAANKEAPAPRRAAHPVPWVIWRRSLKQYFRSLDVTEGWALDAVRSGTSFADVCEGLCEWIDARHVPARAAGMLKRWVTDGLIASIK